MIAELQKLIRTSGVSQRIIAQRADLPERTLARFMHGQTDLKLSTVQKIANALGHRVVLSNENLDSRTEPPNED
jgi:predicted transcriptional regulator